MTELFQLSAPRSAQAHLVDSGNGLHLLVPDGSRLYEVDAATYAQLDGMRHSGDEGQLRELLQRLGVDAPRYVDDAAPQEPPVRALSLAVAQKCNLGCTYCYAQGGSFGGPATSMELSTALASVDLLFGDVAAGERVNLSFLGGEPLMNRPVIHAATDRARAIATDRGVDVTFSITTNGTQLTADDGDFFEEHGFAVTVSLDGVGAVHDQLRPFRGGRGSFNRVIERVAPLLERQRRMQVSARVTVTPANLELKETLDAFVALGFHSVGFSPLLRSPNGGHELGSTELAAMLDGMVACGAEFERRVVAGERYPFANAVNAMREIHRGTHRPYPCGAGAGYLGVSASGELAACHRFVGDDDGALGDIVDGVDRERQARWLRERHVHRQEPCRSCWARYMCGGGCHHEVIARGRPACDYIRGWLHWCLGAYARLAERRPDYFTAAP
ncbi:MAG: SPASM domain-containing protein [Solirubrobacterales bacterium]|nr:SPASM domain-containing protein [Solirubrobacterales bacterium]